MHAILNPVALSSVENNYLGIFLQTHIRNGKFVFFTDELFLLPEIAHDHFSSKPGLFHQPLPFTHFKLALPLQATLRAVPPDDSLFCVADYYQIEVLSGNTLQHPACGFVDEVIGYLHFPTNCPATLNYVSQALYTFNPLQLTDFQQRFLARWLAADAEQTQCSEKVLPAFTAFKGDAIIPAFQLTCQLIRRRREAVPQCATPCYPDDFRYDIAPTHPSSLVGSYGKVNDIAGCLVSHRNGKLMFKKSKPRVDKSMPLLRWSTESFIAKKFILMGAKHFIHDKPSQSCHFIMRKMAGTPLNNVISLAEHANKIETNKRLEIIIACVYSLLVVHYKKILHCDVKPENIICDLTAQPVTAQLIDFGSSQFFSEKRKTILCTLLFAPPEFFDIYDNAPDQKKIWDKNSDAFSMARTMALILRATKPSPMTYEEAKCYSHTANFPNLFEGLIDLQFSHQEKFRRLLAGLSKQNQSERIDLQVVLLECERMLMERALPHYSEALQRDIQTAFNVGHRCRNQVQALLYAYHAPSHTSDPKHLLDIHTLYCDYVVRLAPHRTEVMQQFVAMQHVRFLNGHTHPDTLLRAIHSAIDTFLTQRHALTVLRNEVAKQVCPHLPHYAANEKILFAIEKQLLRSIVPLTLDEIHQLGLSYRKHYQQLQVAAQSLSLLAPTLTPSR